MAVGNEFAEGNPIEYPAAYAAQIDGAMAVGAVDRSSKRAGYSNTGSYVEIVAPGGDFDDGGLNGLVTQFALDPVVRSAERLRPRFDRYTLISVEGHRAATRTWPVWPPCSTRRASRARRRSRQHREHGH